MIASLESELLHIPPRTGPAWWVGSDTYIFKLTGADTDGAFAVFEMSIPPQSGFPPHLHLHEDESSYVLEGELEIQAEENSFIARAGAFVFIPKRTLHACRNPGQSLCRVLVTVAPAGLEDFYLEVGQPARAGQLPPPMGAEQMERLKAVAPKYGLVVSSPE